MMLDIIFSRSKLTFPVGSWLIQLWQWRRFSHVSISWYSESLGRTMFYQASHGMVHFMNQTRWHEENKIVAMHSIKVSEDTKISVLRKCIDRAGSPYGRLQLLGFVLHPIFKRNIFADKNSTYVCSEIVGEILQDMKLISSQEELDSLLPRDIYDKLSSFGDEYANTTTET